MSVSILIPAFRPTFLRQTIASALAQGLEDFEIIVSDDSGGEALLPIVEQFRDPRLHYVRTAGRVGAAGNVRSLWPQASYDRILFLLDDDLLMPHALPELTAQLDARPDASFCYAQRFLIDEHGRIVRDPPPPRESPIVADHALVSKSLTGQIKNMIGEFSNILINRAVGLTIDDLLAYQGFELQVMGDVGFFLNASRKGPAVGISHPVGAFRNHADQLSNFEFSPRRIIGLGEWELFIRGEYATGGLDNRYALRGISALRKPYRHWAERFPALRIMIPSLERLLESVCRDDRDVLDDQFRADWACFVAEFEGAEAAKAPSVS